MNKHFNPTNSKRKSLMFFGLITATVLIILVWFWFSRTPTTTVTINTNQQSEIFVARGVGEDLESVGSSGVKVEVGVPSKLFIQAVAGDKVTQSGLFIDKQQPYLVNLTLDESNRSVDKYYSGAVRDVFIDNNRGYGIEPKSNTLTQFGIDSFVPQRPSFVGVPFLKKIEWKDKNNFIGLSFREGLVLFKNGSLVKSAGFANSVTDNSGSTHELRFDKQQFPTKVIDISGTKTEQFFLTDNTIFSSNNLGRNLKFINKYNSSKSFQTIAVSSKYIFRLSAPAPAEYVDDQPNRGSVEPLTPSSLSVYKHNGELLFETDVSGSRLVRAAQSSDLGCALTDLELVCVSNSKPVVTPLYSEANADIVSYDKSIFVLSGSSVWRVADAGRSVIRVAMISEQLLSLERSFSLDGAGLIFGLVPTSDSSNYTAQTYKLR